MLTARLGVTEPPSVCIVNAGGGGGAVGGAGAGAAAGAKEEKKAEKTVFELRLDSFDAASKIKVRFIQILFLNSSYLGFQLEFAHAIQTKMAIALVLTPTSQCCS